MRTKVEVIEVDGEGLESLLNKNVMIMCFNYFYTGKLVGVNDTFIKLENPHIVYETDAFSDKNFKDAQKISDNPHYIQISAIESYCESTKTLI